MLHFFKIRINPVSQILGNKGKIKVKYTDQSSRPEDRCKMQQVQSRLYMWKLQLITYNKIKICTVLKRLNLSINTPWEGNYQSKDEKFNLTGNQCTIQNLLHQIVVCSDHFEKECFYHSWLFIIHGCFYHSELYRTVKTKFLKGVAPPTVFTSNNMKNKTQNQRSVFGRKYSKGEFGELIFFAVYVCLSAYNWK